ncbi:MAG: branched-chain amino acid ABC transporter permease [Deltaproteobacteria bacterium]|nr:MAG: branched-chain amino acid ABC transporter permease [Deltaproteobacteria bacterium]
MRSKTFRESYREDIKLFHTVWIKSWLTLFLLVLLSIPVWADPYVIYMTNIAGIAVIAAMGLNILTGFTGQISLGHAAFVALGAYTSAILATKTGWPFWASIPAGGVVAAFFGVLLGFPCLRLKGLYLAMATMSFGVVIEYTVTHWESLTMGVRGISMPEATLFGCSLGDDTRFFYVILFFVILLTIAAKNLIRTRVGRAFVAIRDRDIAAQVIGVDLTKYKVTSFAVSSFYGGIAGGLYSYYIGYLHPENFTILLSIEYIAMIIVGGMGSILGSIFGGIFLTIVPDIIKAFADFLGENLAFFQGRYDEEWNIATFGLLIIVFLIVEPTGLNGIWGRIKTCFKNWPYTY